LIDRDIGHRLSNAFFYNYRLANLLVSPAQRRAHPAITN
jgi:hypothetical protein